MARLNQPFLCPSLSTSSAPDPPRPGSISTTTHRLTPLVVDLPRRGSGETVELVVMLSGTPTEDKGFIANQGAWCSQVTNGGCSTSARRRRRTGMDEGGQSTSLLQVSAWCSASWRTPRPSSARPGLRGERRRGGLQRQQLRGERRRRGPLRPPLRLRRRPPYLILISLPHDQAPPANVSSARVSAGSDDSGVPSPCRRPAASSSRSLVPLPTHVPPPWTPRG